MCTSTATMYTSLPELPTLRVSRLWVVGAAPVALFTASVLAASDLSITSAFWPSAWLISDCLEPSLSRIWDGGHWHCSCRVWNVHAVPMMSLSSKLLLEDIENKENG